MADNDKTMRLRAEVDDLPVIGKFRSEIDLLAKSLTQLSDVFRVVNKNGKTVEVTLKGLTSTGHVVTGVFGKQGLKNITEGVDKDLERRIEKQNRIIMKGIRDVQKMMEAARKKELADDHYLYLKKKEWHEALEKLSLKRAKKEAKDAHDEYLAKKKWHDAQVEIERRKTNQYESELGRQAIGRALGVPSNTDVNQITKANAAIMPVMTAIQKGQINIAQLTNMLYALNKGIPASFVPVNAAQQRVYNSLLRYQKLLSTLPETAAQSSKGVILSMESILRIFQVQLLHRAFSIIMNGFTEAIKVAHDFQIQIARIETISQDVALSARQWGDGIKEAASKHNIELLEATSAAYDAVSNQVAKGAKVFDVLNEAFKFSKITGATAKESIDLISFSINAFKLKSEDANRVAAIMFKTIDLGNVNAKQLADNFGSVAPLAHQAGISLKELAANYVTLTIQGVQADTATTLIKNALKELVSPSEKMKELLKEWGFETGEAAIQQIGFIGVLRKLKQEIDTGGLARIKEIFPDIRGMLAAVGTIGGKNLEIFTQAMDKLNESVQSFENANHKMDDTPALQMSKAWNEVKIVFDGLGQSIITAANNLSKMVGFIPKEMLDNLKTIKQFLDLMNGETGKGSKDNLSPEQLDRLKKAGLTVVDSNGIPKGERASPEEIAQFKAVGGTVVKSGPNAMELIYNAMKNSAGNPMGSMHEMAALGFDLQANSAMGRGDFQSAQIAREMAEKIRKRGTLSDTIDEISNPEKAAQRQQLRDKFAEKLKKNNGGELGFMDERMMDLMQFFDLTPDVEAKLPAAKVGENKQGVKNQLNKINADWADAQKKLDDMLGGKSYDQRIKEFNKELEKSDSRIRKIQSTISNKNFNNLLIGKDDDEVIKKYNDQMDSLFDKLNNFKNIGKIQILDNSQIEQAKLDVEDLLKTAIDFNKEVSKNIARGQNRLERLQREKFEADLDKRLVGKTSSQKAKIFEDEINKVLTKARGSRDIDEQNKLYDEALAFSKRRDALTTKFGKTRKATVKDDLTQRILDEATKQAQKYVDTQKRSLIDLNNLKQYSVTIEDAIKNNIRKQNIELTRQRDLVTEIVRKRQGLQREAGESKDSVDVPGHALGGMIRGPMGRDNLLIRAHAGEFIMNSEATAAFYPQLVAMNAGFQPRGFANGGPVTNVGDINISMNAEKSVEANVREIGYRLRREIKRGTVRLN